MALPDALISSVGTKVFQRRVDGSWAEDLQWSACLDEGWDLNQAREAAYHAVAAVGREQMHFRPPDEQNDHKVGMPGLPHPAHLDAEDFADYDGACHGRVLSLQLASCWLHAHICCMYIEDCRHAPGQRHNIASSQSRGKEMAAATRTGFKCSTDSCAHAIAGNLWGACQRR